MTTETEPPDTNGAAPLAAALAAFQAEMPTVAKTKTADTGTYRYTYADLAAVTEAAMPLLTAQGLSFSTVPRYTEHGYELVGVLLHASGESMEGALPIHGSSAQQLGSAITYARRYLLGCMTGVVTDDDDDGRSAGGGAAPAVKKAATRKKAAAADPVPTTSGGASVAAVQKMLVLMSELGLRDKAAALDYVQGVTGRRVESRNDLSAKEVSAVIDALQTRGVAAPPETPAGPKGGGHPPIEPAPTPRGSAGPPPADDPWAVQDVPLPAPPTAPPTVPPERVTAPTAERIRRLLKVQLGDVATEAEELALLAAILEHPVPSVEALSRADGQRVGATLNRFADGSLKWEFDLSDPSGVPAVRISRPPLHPEDA